jgi:hypothetical protein
MLVPRSTAPWIAPAPARPPATNCPPAAVNATLRVVRLKGAR